MTQDEIIEMARQAGATEVDEVNPQCFIGDIAFSLGDIKDFAKLIDAKATAKAVERERKACADLMFEIDLCGREGVAFKAIKARGEA
jgi:hypothetical protein